MKTYVAEVTRDQDGAWLVSVPSVPGCHTYGRTLGAARRRIREALRLWVNDAGRAQIEFVVHVPVRARRVIDPYIRARIKAEAASEEARAALRLAAERLTEQGMSLRDAGELLGLSHQRIAQVLEAGS